MRQLRGRICSVDSSVPTILWSQVWIPSTPSMLFPFIIKFCTKFVIALWQWWNQTKRGQVWPIVSKNINRWMGFIRHAYAQQFHPLYAQYMCTIRCIHFSVYIAFEINIQTIVNRPLEGSDCIRRWPACLFIVFNCFVVKRHLGQMDLINWLQIDEIALLLKDDYEPETCLNWKKQRAVIVAQLTEWSLLISSGLRFKSNRLIRQT